MTKRPVKKTPPPPPDRVVGPADRVVDRKNWSQRETEVYNELVSLPNGEVMDRHVVLVAHVREMFANLPSDRTMGKIARVKEDGKDREGPMVARLRELSL
jgi:hypothetical protein